VPNYDLKIPCVLSSNRTVEPNDYDYIKQKRNERNVLYDKNDLTYLDKWIKDDKHPSIKYYAADIRYSELSKTNVDHQVDHHLMQQLQYYLQKILMRKYLMMHTSVFLP
jgi:hypothetical protein